MRIGISLILLLIFSSSGAALDFRCPNTGKLVKAGMSMYEVKLACGEPQFRAVGGTVIGNLSANTGTLGPEQWTYDFGPSSFLQFFIFDGGYLRAIQRGDQYGTPKSQKRTK